MIVVAIIGILAAIAVPLYGQHAGPGAHREGQADIRGLASAVSVYTPHGTLPSVLDLLTAIATSPQNITAGPFMAAIPTRQHRVAARTPSLSRRRRPLHDLGRGDGATVSAP